MFWKDIRFALRILRRTPGYTLLAALVVAVGIGSTASIFSVLKTVVLEPLPYPSTDRLITVWLDNRIQGWPEDITSFPNYADWRDRNQVFEQLAAYRTRSYNLTGDGEPRRVRAGAVTHDFFQTMGVQPLYGRDFKPEEDVDGAEAVVILGHSFWQSAWGGDPAAVGQKITLQGEVCQIVGVAPPELNFPADVEVWHPLAPSEGLRNARGALWLPVIGRLKPGVTLTRAQAEMSRIAANLEQEYPDTNEGYGINLKPLHDHVVGEARPGLWLMMAAVGLLLVIACANAAGLALVRAVGRRRELTIRTALGASRARVIRQLLAESVLLALAGGVLGIVLAHAALAALLGLAPELPRLSQVSIDWVVLLAAVGVAVLSGVLIGLAPALEVTRTDPSRVLTDGGRGQSMGVGGRRLRQVLVVAEVALCLVLLVGSGLLIRSLLELRRVDPGLEVDGLLTLNLATSGPRYQEGPQRSAFYAQLLERVRAVPGVTEAGATSALFIPLLTNSATFTIEGRPPVPQSERVEVPIDIVTEGFFETVRVPLLAGRLFDGTDTEESPRVVLINQTMARRFWPDGDPVGDRFKYGGPDSDSPWMRIVGVVADVKRSGLDRPVRPSTFVPHSQVARGFMTLVVRTPGDPQALIPALRSAVWELDAELPVFSVSTVREQLDDSLAQRRFLMTLLTIFSGLALLLALVGVYGVVSYSASQRTREMGVRLALGAKRGQVLRLVLGEGFRLAALGAVLGLAGAFAVTRFMESLLFGVGAADPVSLLAVGLLVVGTSIAACCFPALRAARVDPASALRYE